MPAVCLPPVEVGLQMGWEVSSPGEHRERKGCFLAVEKGELVREKAAALSIPRRMQVMRCGALVPLPTLRAVSGCLGRHTGMSKCISGVSDFAAFSLLRRKKGDKGAICRLLINITGLSQQSMETIEAGWAYQKLHEIVGFDQHLIALRLLGSVPLTLSPVLEEAGWCRSWLHAPAADCMSVRWVDGT